MEIDEVIGSHDRVAVRGSLVGTNRGNLFGVPATNEKVDIPFHELHHLRDGRLTHTYYVEDWFGMFLRLGQWPPCAECLSRALDSIQEAGGNRPGCAHNPLTWKRKTGRLRRDCHNF
jgi:hypothetical protein